MSCKNTWISLRPNISSRPRTHFLNSPLQQAAQGLVRSMIFICVLSLLVAIVTTSVVPAYGPFDIRSHSAYAPASLAQSHSWVYDDSMTRHHLSGNYHSIVAGSADHTARFYEPRLYHGYAAHDTFDAPGRTAGNLRSGRYDVSVNDHERVVSDVEQGSLGAGMMRTTYTDYLVKPLQCQSISTHCCGSKTHIAATCGGSDKVLVTFISANDYNYTLKNTHFTDLSGRYFLGSVKLCNLDTDGDVFVSVW